MAESWNFNVPPQVTPSPSLHPSYFGQPLPLHLVATDIFRVHTEDMSENAHPKRVFFDDLNNVYIYADLASNPAQVYFVRNDPQHTMLGSVLFSHPECLHPRNKTVGPRNPDEPEELDTRYVVTDFCIHLAEKDNFCFSFLLVNAEIPRVTLIRFCVKREIFEETPPEGVNFKTYRLGMKDLELSANILEHKSLPEMFVPSEIKKEVPPTYIPIGTVGGKTYALPQIEKIIPHLASSIYIGALNPLYCGLACTEQGQYIVLLQSTIKVWISPYISLPVDVQYIVLLDEHGMMVKWVLAGPLTAAISFDETTPGQPYLSNPTIIEGNILVCLEHKKARTVRPVMELLRSNNPLPPHTWYEIPKGHESWEGGVVADRYVSHYMLSGAHCGYAEEWETPDDLEPHYRETTWQSTDIRRLLNTKHLPDLSSVWRKMSLAHYVKEKGPVTSLSTWGMYGTTFLDHNVVRFSLDALLFFVRDPEHSGIPQTSITLSGLVPGESRVYNYHVQNNAQTLTIKQLKLTFADLPTGMSVSVSQLPPVICPGEKFPFTITASYTPPVGTQPDSHIVISVATEYYLVVAKEVNEVTVASATVSLTVGESAQLSYSILPLDACNKTIYWTSDNPALVSVNQNGTITAVAGSTGGQTYVRATSDETGRSGSSLITVSMP